MRILGIVAGLRDDEKGAALFRLQDGTFVRIDHDESSFAQRDALKEAGAAYAFHDPFEAEFIWLEWAKIPLVVWEKMLGAAFVPSDFQSLKKKQVSIVYPETWSVMF